MPYTVSHIAAVVPGYRPLSRAHVFSAAVIGSMTPDFGLLLPTNLVRWQTHSLMGLLDFCLPVGLCAYWLTQLLIKPAMLEVLPDRAFARLRREHPPASIRSPRQWLYAAVALLLGAVTHLIWDAFTHENARGVRMFPVLSDYGPEMAGHWLHVYRWLQYGSSLVGLAVVAAALMLWWRHAARPAEPLHRRLGPSERRAWLGVYLALPLLDIAWSIWRSWFAEFTQLGSGGALRSVAEAAMRGAAVALLLVSALILLRSAAGRAH
jgi:membrane-bound metal-dependent hydrolase YbcI (DUF457 family)